MHAMRHWSVRHSRGLEVLYHAFERTLVAFDPLWRGIGYARLERPVAAVERAVKGLVFDCRMCGQCVLGSTGMSCPMNCPKELRNGPCGGVRVNGHCDVEPGMKCVWVEAMTTCRTSGSVLANAIVDLPVSDEFDCRICHASGVGIASPTTGWVFGADADRDERDYARS